jgi:hypothetical protein
MNKIDEELIHTKENLKRINSNEEINSKRLKIDQQPVRDNNNNELESNEQLLIKSNHIETAYHILSSAEYERYQLQQFNNQLQSFLFSDQIISSPDQFTNNRSNLLNSTTNLTNLFNFDSKFQNYELSTIQKSIDEFLVHKKLTQSR